MLVVVEFMVGNFGCGGATYLLATLGQMDQMTKMAKSVNTTVSTFQHESTEYMKIKHDE